MKKMQVLGLVCKATWVVSAERSIGTAPYMYCKCFKTEPTAI